MKDDFVLELGYVSLAVRLKRISEFMIHSGRQMYKILGLDIEPNWFLIFKILDRYERLSITEIAQHLRFSHPSVISMVKKMKQKDYLLSQVDQQDSRRQLVSLSPKAKKILPRLEHIWTMGEIGLDKLFSPGQDFLKQLEKLEVQLREKSFMERTLNELDNEK